MSLNFYVYIRDEKINLKRVDFFLEFDFSNEHTIIILQCSLLVHIRSNKS